MPTATTLASIMRSVCAALHEGDARFPFVSTTTSVGTATTLVDRQLIYAGADTNLLGQCLLRIDETVTQAFSPAVTINEGAAFSATDTTLTVNDGSGVLANDVLVIESERLLVTVVAVNNLTVTRGIDGTTAASHADGTAVTRSGPIAGTVTRVVSAGLTIATGTITVDTMRGHVLSGTDYSLWVHSNPLAARRLLNRLLRNKRREVVSPLTLVTDGDMETAGVANWTTVGTVSTEEKVTTATYVRHGTQSLHIINGAAASGKRTTSYPAVRNKTWLVAATIKVVTGTVTLAGYDATNSANIESPPSTSEVAWQTLFYTFTIPTTCVNVQARMTAGNLAEFYVDSLNLWPSEQVEYDLPSWIEDPYKDLLDIGYFWMSSSPVGNYLYTPEEGEWVSVNYSLSPIVDEAGAHPFRIILERPVKYPLYIKAMRPFAELSADTDTTTANAEGLILGTLWHIYDQLAAANVANKEAYQLWSDRRNNIGLRAFAQIVRSRELRPRLKVIARYGEY